MAEFKPVTVVKGDVEYTCTVSEEQVKAFLDAGYVIKKAKKTTEKKEEK